jgi:hypothetical protein
MHPVGDQHQERAEGITNTQESCLARMQVGGLKPYFVRFAVDISLIHFVRTDCRLGRRLSSGNLAVKWSEKRDRADIIDDSWAVWHSPNKCHTGPLVRGIALPICIPLHTYGGRVSD